eukprot:TRINITY_DN168_c0_g2_i1.p1 TRINITY_DN168_c0_g2~~TRINITY_DN168_c0_g2_i1.p1  ORF type:complete len:330 (-),score=67.21 TRINITY_DN168_c0_g2_i1:420-1409(-)
MCLFGDISDGDIFAEIDSCEIGDKVVSYDSIFCPLIRLTGYSKASEDMETSDMSLRTLGRFCAPERYNGIASKKNDSWSLGAIVLQTLTAANYRFFDVQRLAERAFSTDKELIDIICQLLQRDQEKRLSIDSLMEKVKRDDWQRSAALAVPLLKVAYSCSCGIEVIGPVDDLFHYLTTITINAERLGEPLEQALRALSVRQQGAFSDNMCAPLPMWGLKDGRWDSHVRDAVKPAQTRDAAGGNPKQMGPLVNSDEAKKGFVSDDLQPTKNPPRKEAAQNPEENPVRGGDNQSAKPAQEKMLQKPHLRADSVGDRGGGLGIVDFIDLEDL